MLVEFRTGQENFPEAGSAMSAFVRTGAETVFISKSRAVRAAGALRKSASSSASPALGNVFTQNYDLPDGTLIELMAKRRESWQSSDRPARIILEAHNDAALIKVSAKTLNATHSNFDEYHVTGRFYILTPDQFAAKMISVGTFAVPFYDPVRADAVFTVTQLEAARRSAPIVTRETIETENGSEDIAAARRRRALDL